MLNKSNCLTKPLNQNIGAAIHIADNENYNTNNLREGRQTEVVVTGYGMDKRKAGELPNIDFEKIKVTANINAKFMLK